MRKIKVQTINQAAATIVVSGDYTRIFQGKFYRNPDTEQTVPGYTTPVPAGYSFIRATTFEIIGNVRFAGRYTVYSPISSSDTPSSVFANGKTTIKLADVMPQILPGDPPTVTGDGYIVNCSTYLVSTFTGDIVIPPNVDIVKYPVEFIGRDFDGWGEIFLQNIANVACNFAAPNGPANPFIGQTWYDTDDAQVRVWQGSSWELLNKESLGITFRHVQSTASRVWTVNHMLNLKAPFIGICQFFVDEGNGPKMIFPSDVEYVNQNQMTVTFTNPEIGYVLVRS